MSTAMDPLGHFITLAASEVRSGDLLVESGRRLRIGAPPRHEGHLVHFPVQVWRESWIAFGFWSLPLKERVLVLRSSDRPIAPRSREVLLKLARQWISEHPHTSLEEMLEGLSASGDEAMVLQTASTLRVSIGSSLGRQAQALKSLSRVRVLVRVPLTPSSYEQHRRDDEPSADAVAVLFGSWSAACLSASIPPGRNARPVLPRWSDEDLLAPVRQYLRQTSVPSARGFERWLVSRGKRAPLLSVIFSRLGSWPVLAEMASSGDRG